MYLCGIPAFEGRVVITSGQVISSPAIASFEPVKYDSTVCAAAHDWHAACEALHHSRIVR